VHNRNAAGAGSRRLSVSVSKLWLYIDQEANHRKMASHLLGLLSGKSLELQAHGVFAVFCSDFIWDDRRRRTVFVTWTLDAGLPCRALWLGCVSRACASTGSAGATGSTSRRTIATRTRCTAAVTRRFPVTIRLALPRRGAIAGGFAVTKRFAIAVAATSGAIARTAF
jgi:hypothetical protein